MSSYIVTGGNHPPEELSSLDLAQIQFACRIADALTDRKPNVISLLARREILQQATVQPQFGDARAFTVRYHHA